MSTTAYEDVSMLALERPFTFDDYEPRNVPGYTSNIASIFRCSENQTGKLLEAVDNLAAGHRHVVDRRPVEYAEPAAEGEERPRKYRVTVSSA